MSSSIKRNSSSNYSANLISERNIFMENYYKLKNLIYDSDTQKTDINKTVVKTLLLKLYTTGTESVKKQILADFKKFYNKDNDKIIELIDEIDKDNNLLYHLWLLISHIISTKTMNNLNKLNTQRHNITKTSVTNNRYIPPNYVLIDVKDYIKLLTDEINYFSDTEEEELISYTENNIDDVVKQVKGLISALDNEATATPFTFLEKAISTVTGLEELETEIYPKTHSLGLEELQHFYTAIKKDSNAIIDGIAYIIYTLYMQKKHMSMTNDIFKKLEDGIIILLATFAILCKKYPDNITAYYDRYLLIIARVISEIKDKPTRAAVKSLIKQLTQKAEIKEDILNITEETKDVDIAKLKALIGKMLQIDEKLTVGLNPMDKQNQLDKIKDLEVKFRKDIEAFNAEKQYEGKAYNARPEIAKINADRQANANKKKAARNEETAQKQRNAANKEKKKAENKAKQNKLNAWEKLKEGPQSLVQSAVHSTDQKNTILTERLAPGQGYRGYAAESNTKKTVSQRNEEFKAAMQKAKELEARKGKSSIDDEYLNMFFTWLKKYEGLYPEPTPNEQNFISSLYTRYKNNEKFTKPEDLLMLQDLKNKLRNLSVIVREWSTHMKETQDKEISVIKQTMLTAKINSILLQMGSVRGGSGKLLTKRRKLAKRLQTKKRRV